MTLAMGQERTLDPLAEAGFQAFYNLEYEEALTAFSKKIATNPNDPIAHNHLAQTLLYFEMFRNGSLESELVNGTNPFVSRPKLNVLPEHGSQFTASIRKSIALSQDRLKTNARDTRALYALGVAYGLRANWNFIVHKQMMDPLRDAAQARKLHNQATDIDPNFSDARLIQGVHEYILGSLPLPMRMLSFMAGMSGNREAGIRMLKLVSEKGSLNRADAAVLLWAILRREKRQREALPLLVSLTERFPRNYLLRLELAILYTDMGDRRNAMAQIDRLEQLRVAGAPGFKNLAEEKIHYARGNVYFSFDDCDSAIAALNKATSGARKLDTTTAALAWLRQGQAYDLKGMRKLAVSSYQQAANLAPKSDSGREARDYMSSPYKRKRRA